jgi:hypothetical protein
MRTKIKIMCLFLTVLIAQKIRAQHIDIKTTDTTLTIIAPGDYFDGQAVYLSNQIAKKYHFQYDYIGDLRPEDSLELIGQHNEHTDTLLTVINGKNWRQRYNSEFSEAYLRDSILIQLAKSKIATYVDTTKFKIMVVYRDSILYDTIYRVNVFGYNNQEQASVLRIFATYPDKIITAVDNKVIYRRQRK